MPKLGVNIDHVATLRQARKGIFPDPVTAALLCEKAGAQSIVAHLREDRRHIQDKDIIYLRKKIKTKLNLEMSIASDIVKIACRVKPYQATLVPEKRMELTTEGGLDVAGNLKKINSAVKKLKNAGIKVSLFIDPVKKQIDAAKAAGTNIIELHTGKYADAKNNAQKEKYFNEIKHAARYALRKGFVVNAGHGLDYENVKRVAAIKGMEELNIGFSIVSMALFTGIFEAVKKMNRLVR